MKKDHHDNAIVNCSEWDKCLRYRGDKQLIDNIKFHNRDIKDAQVVVNDQVDAVTFFSNYVVIIKKSSEFHHLGFN